MPPEQLVPMRLSATRRVLDVPALGHEVEFPRNTFVAQLRVMREMEKMSVDITKVLVSQHVQPDNLIRLETGAPGEGGKAAAAKDGKGLLGALQLNL